MIEVAICICTRRRTGSLKRLLESINLIIVPDGYYVEVIVVENDYIERSKLIIDLLKRNFRFPIKYFLEAKQGISYARNRSIKEAESSELCCFVDDDQIVKEDWLAELIRCHKEYDADGVSGHTPPLFEFPVPIYIKEHHRDEIKPYGTIVNQAATGCLMVKKKWLDKINGPFDISLSFTGGEDFYMTSQISNLGAVIRVNPSAISYEVIPKERAKIQYVLRRTFRTANTKLIVRSKLNESEFGIIFLLKTFSRLLLGIFIALPCFLLCTRQRLLGLFKVSYSLGEIFYIIGRKNRFYK